MAIKAERWVDLPPPVKRFVDLIVVHMGCLAPLRRLPSVASISWLAVSLSLPSLKWKWKDSCLDGRASPPPYLPHSNEQSQICFFSVVVQQGVQKQGSSARWKRRA